MSWVLRACWARVGAYAGFVFLGMQALSAGQAEAGAKYKILYWFCQDDAQLCKDGQNPQTGLVEDAHGNIFGGVGTGGPLGSGGIYMVTAKGKETVIYNFCSRSQCADGQYPRDLIMSKSGDIYGNTSSGGAHGQGVVYKLSTSKKGGWKYSVLYSFCSTAQCTDGSQPWASLTYTGRDAGQLYDGASPLYGATSMGGATGNGVVFRLSFAAGKKKPAYDVLYNFCSKTNCSDGAQPLRTPTVDAAGNIFGVAAGGDANNDGVVFQLSPNGDSYNETVLHTFCSETNCADGSNPSGIAIDANGTLFGVTGLGGEPAGSGVVFKIVPNGRSSQETVLYNFCAQENCSDGAYPNNGLVIAPNGDIYGTAEYWGGEQFSQSGLVYKLHGTTETVIHSFCAEQTCPDGAFPIANVMLDGKGTLYGTTEVGGPSGNGGVLFKITKP